MTEVTSSSTKSKFSYDLTFLLLLFLLGRIFRQQFVDCFSDQLQGFVNICWLEFLNDRAAPYKLVGLTVNHFYFESPLGLGLA